MITRDILGCSRQKGLNFDGQTQGFCYTVYNVKDHTHEEVLGLKDGRTPAIQMQENLVILTG